MGGYGLIGHPLGHSISPLIHVLSLDHPYNLIDIEPRSFKQDVSELLKTLSGFNVTVPYKQQIMPMLSGVDKTAAHAGAVNTVCDGVGYNTDVSGFARDFLGIMQHHQVKRAVIIGAGGAAHAIALGLMTCQIYDLLICVRDQESSLIKGRQLADRISGWQQEALSYTEQNDQITQVSQSFTVQVVTELELVHKICPQTALINASPKGMYPQVKTCPLTKETLHALFSQNLVSVVYDAVYNPLVTQLMMAAQQHGIAAYNGLMMLINQAQDAQAIWANHSAEKTISSGCKSLDSKVVSTLCKRHLLACHPQIFVLTGFMGAGKSTTLKLLEQMVPREVACIDLDDEIAAHAQRSISEIFATEGEDGFRELERDVLTKIVQDAQTTTVIAAGGATLVQPWGRDLIDRFNLRVIHLDISLSEAYRRIQNQRSVKDRHLIEHDECVQYHGSAADLSSACVTSHDRPLAESFDLLAERYEQRIKLYRECAGIVLLADQPSQVLASQVYQAICAEKPQCDREFFASNRTGVICGRNLLNTFVQSLSDVLDEDTFLALRNGSRKALIVADPHTKCFAATIAKQLKEYGLQAVCSLIEAGESGKELSYVMDLWERCSELDLSRADLVISCGGGVVSDVAGFVASTYKRGVRLIHVPTTLTCAVDACLGGKTGFNFAGYKNHIGTFYEPTAVVIDPALFSSLNERELRCGIGEIIKYHVLDKERMPYHMVRVLIDELIHEKKEEAYSLSSVLLAALEIKRTLVDQDVYDTGARMLLNAGHTIGHALEAATNFREFSHGEAVVLGLVCELECARNDALQNFAPDTREVKEIEAVLNRVISLALQGGFCLMSSAEYKAVIQAIKVDKKCMNQQVTMISVDEQGKTVLKSYAIADLERLMQEVLPKYMR